uniref:Uncharacterized protein n=1 Tax=Brassica oleracea var. oleracea TaxID=109376 RepID=A0A0D3DKP7_BRAOL
MYLEDEVTHSPDRNPAVQGSKLAGDWEILVVYLKRYKDIHARLPVTVASTLLQADSCIEMPLWLVQMFKDCADCRDVKITRVFNRNNAEQVGVFGGSHSKKENDVANEDLSIVRIYIKSRDSRSRIEDSR